MSELSSVPGKQDYSLSISCCYYDCDHSPTPSSAAPSCSTFSWEMGKRKREGARAGGQRSPPLTSLPSSSSLPPAHGRLQRPPDRRGGALAYSRHRQNGAGRLKRPLRATALSCPSKHRHCHPGPQPGGMRRAGPLRQPGLVMHRPQRGSPHPETQQRETQGAQGSRRGRKSQRKRK